MMRKLKRYKWLTWRWVGDTIFSLMILGFGITCLIAAAMLPTGGDPMGFVAITMVGCGITCLGIKLLVTGIK